MTAEEGETVEGLASEATVSSEGMSYPDLIVARLTARGLDFDRSCQYKDHGDCWLCHTLDPWNRVLHPVSLELIETQPATLAIRSLSTDRRQYSDEDELYDAAFVFCWLPKAHPCVQSITLEGVRMVLFYRPAFTLALSLGQSLNVQHLALRAEGDTPVSEEELSEGLAGLHNLKSLDLSSLTISASLSRPVADLLRRNASRVTAVTFSGNRMSQNTVNRIFRALQLCRALGELSICRNNLSRGCMNSLARLVRLTKSLRKLTLSQSVQDIANLTAISEALKVNTSLTELRLSEIEEGQYRCFFEALTVNETLKHLELTSCNISGGNAESLAEALEKNRGLRDLELTYCHIDDSSAEALARGLEKNSALETIDLKRNHVSVRAVNAFCRMLRKNSTLKKALFCDVEGTEQERTNLSFHMAQAKGYSRILMTWAEPDIPPLSAAVALPAESPTELHLTNTTELSESNICALLENLATNTDIKVFSIEIRAQHKATTEALCAALVSNRTLQRLEVATANDDSDAGLFAKVAKALITNETLSEMQLKCSEISLRSLKSIAFMLSKNTTITKLELDVARRFGTKRMAIISRAMTKNRSVVNFATDYDTHVNRVSYRIFNAVRRNTGFLNLAVRFLTQQRLDRQAAVAFEALSGSASLLQQVMKVTEQTEEQTRAAVFSAKSYILSNYLRLAGVVQGDVVCHPGTGTQIDALNHECWCAIASYLRISDVVLE
ncbi:uncharacterized protein LOC144106727 [Amblyomma americanum]